MRLASARALACLTIVCAILPAHAAAASEADIGRFNLADGALPPAPWRIVRLTEKVPATQFRLLRWEGVEAVEAKAEASMAMLARPVSVNLAQTPVLCWRWRVDDVLKSANIRSKAGDDYAARIYVAFSLPSESMSWGLRTKLALARSIWGDAVPDAAISYVWDNAAPIGTRLANAYTDRTQMMVLRSGKAEIGRWVSERRDVLADAQKAFDVKNMTIASLAVSADTDNTQESARAGFAELHFVARDAPCSFSH